MICILLCKRYNKTSCSRWGIRYIWITSRIVWWDFITGKNPIRTIQCDLSLSLYLSLSWSLSSQEKVEHSHWEVVQWVSDHPPPPASRHSPMGGDLRPQLWRKPKAQHSTCLSAIGLLMLLPTRWSIQKSSLEIVAKEIEWQVLSDRRKCQNRKKNISNEKDWLSTDPPHLQSETFLLFGRKIPFVRMIRMLKHHHHL